MLAAEPSGPKARLKLPFTVDEASQCVLRPYASARERSGRYATELEVEPLRDGALFQAELPPGIDRVSLSH